MGYTILYWRNLFVLNLRNTTFRNNTWPIKVCSKCGQYRTTFNIEMDTCCFSWGARASIFKNLFDNSYSNPPTTTLKWGATGMPIKKNTSGNANSRNVLHITRMSRNIIHLPPLYAKIEPVLAGPALGIQNVTFHVSSAIRRHIIF
jgi:hypothetical protein